MAVYMRLGKNWGVGLPWYAAMWVLPVWLLWAGFVLVWNVFLFTWFALVWTYKAFAWAIRSTARDIQKIRSRHAPSE